MFGRSKSTQGVEPVAGSASSLKEGGKGRPTPKRREAERGRRHAVSAPTNRKEAAKLTRARQREERLRTSQALKSGDERGLPARDRGPVRGYVRDMVDARRSAGEFFLPVALIILLLAWLGNTTMKLAGNTLWLLLVVLIVVDSVLLVVRLRRGLARSFPEGNLRGAVSYGLMRSMQIRRFRLPPPRTKSARRSRGWGRTRG